MGLFSRDYSKPGPGIDKDAPQKNAFFKFFELFARKFFTYIGLNLAYLLVILPVVVFFYVTLYSFLYSAAGTTGEIVPPPMLDLCLILYDFVPQMLHAPLVILSLILYGPATMGMTYVLRNFAREEHAWPSDFVVKAMENFKQGLFFGALDVSVVIIFYFNWNYGYIWGADGAAMLIATAVRWASVVVAVYYLFMRNYFYQLAVTVRLPIRHIIKNAAIFGIVGLLRNILTTIFVLGIAVGCTLVSPLVEIIMLPALMFSLCGFIAVYTTYPIVHKHVVQPLLDAERADEQSVPEAVLPPELGGPGAGGLAIERLTEDADDSDDYDEFDD